MTAAAGVLTGLAKLKRQDSARNPHGPSSTAPGQGNSSQEAAPRKRKRRTDVVVVRGRLHLYSASGFFLLLGLVILAVGICMATLGYWPHSETMTSARSSAGGGSKTTTAGGAKTSATGEGNGAEMAVTDEDVANSSTSHDVQGTPSRQTGGALTRFLEQHRHSERMKMFGPFTMGIGIFIFICANAILHENRDRETKIIHMRDMYSTVIDIHRLRQREQKQHQHRDSTYAREVGDLRAFGADSAARLASNSLLAFSSRAGGGAGGEGSAEEEEVLLGDEEFRRQGGQARLDCSFAGLLAPLYKDHPFRLARSESVRHQWSVDRDGEKGGHHARSIVSSSISAFTLPVIKLNNCVIDEPEMEAITEEERGGERRDGERSQPLSSMESLVVPVASVAKASKPPGLHRSNSASSSSHCSSVSSYSLSPAPSSTSGCWLSPGAARSDFGSNSSLHMLGSHSKSLDLERGPSMLSVHPEQRKHPSWPRLDRSNSSRCNGGNRGGSSSKGYARLEDREEQGERLLDASASAAAARREYSRREKLLMISRSHNNLSFEHDEFNSTTLKRGSSETRF
ncbi:transmembrane protein 200A [Anarrhichthys ocellatus]|uniref:transmembrane protein 200A n=1 Tax=Anarrhichthys ocellatus TaxID=433405 RepID=UPI0012ED6E8B|nr:transmembrane protein 200A [Anarrhichthys ocellatus]XP_031722027.1 transmembrane protein 200A [Anarrhichthys ocellatus]XP_031722028.1 transmembrane protein 200A [Anarrhichthys ocellatus]